MKTLALAIVLLIGATSAYAGPFDGSTALTCEIKTVMICDPGVCVLGTADTALLPRVISVDVPGRLVTGGGAGRRIKIVSVGRGADRLLLHGEEMQMSGTAWNVVVEEGSGAMTGAVLTRTGGYIMFGDCSPK